ncbi:MAG: pyrroline-5-carboxylate reductase [Gammaproteobacteria bacterium]|nr:pyrroline-5-carboxylate reductase [Gammaproteobacteria bacterium]
MKDQREQTKPSANRIAFIGAGNMARSLISGLLASGHAATDICASDPSVEQRSLIEALGVATHATNAPAIEDADIIVAAVKPQVLGEVLNHLTIHCKSQLLISVAAGAPINSLQAWTSKEQPIVRCMPNTPALLGVGVTALYANAHVRPDQHAAAQRVLEAAGKVVWLTDETQLDAVTAVSGSGPAYFFYLMEAMVAAATELGLDKETATFLTLETAYGAACMARNGDPSPATLRENVTSPGGTTERALSILNEHNVHASIKQALAGATRRAEELAEEFGNS